MQKNITHKQSAIFTWMKYICAIMVVYIHSTPEPKKITIVNMSKAEEIIRRFIDNGRGGFLSVAVPCFFCLAGFFVYISNDTYLTKIKKRIKTLVIPYFLVNIFWICFFALFSNLKATGAYFTDYKISTLSDVIHGLLGRPPVYYPFWFMRDLFFMILFSPIYLFLVEKVPLLYVAFLIGCVVKAFSIPYILPTGYLIWFSLGLFCAKYRLFDRIEKIPSWLSILIWMSGIFMCMLEYYLFGYLVVIAGIISLYHIGGYISEHCSTELTNRVKGYIFPLYAFHEYWEAMLKKGIFMFVPQNETVRLLILLFVPLIIILLIQSGKRAVTYYIAGHFQKEKTDSNES